MGQSTDRATIERVRRELGWDRPCRPVRGVRRPARPGRPGPVDPEQPARGGGSSPRYPLTLLLAVASLVLATTLGLGLGVLAALYRERFLDAVATALAVVGISMPSFLARALADQCLVSVRWGCSRSWAPSPRRHLVLPAITLGVLSAAAIARLVRSSLLETLGQDFIRTAWAKGLPRSSRHRQARASRGARPGALGDRAPVRLHAVGRLHRRGRLRVAWRG